MIIYNVTSKVSNDIAADWLEWIKSVHIPLITDTGCFTHAVILHLMEMDDEEGKTYAIQCHSTDIKLYNHYCDNTARSIEKMSAEKWGDKVISFKSVMKVVH